MSIQGSINNALGSAAAAAAIGKHFKNIKDAEKEETNRVERAAQLASQDEDRTIQEINEQRDVIDKITKEIEAERSAPGTELAGPNPQKTADLVNKLGENQEIDTMLTQAGLKVAGGYSDIYKQAFVRTGDEKYLDKIKNTAERLSMYEEDLKNPYKDANRYKAELRAFNALYDEVAKNEGIKDRVGARAHIFQVGQKAAEDLKAQKQAQGYKDKFNMFLLQEMGGKI